MREIDNFRVTGHKGFDAAKYKRERRIKSGADAIIRGVLPFMPVGDDDDSARR